MSEERLATRKDLETVEKKMAELCARLKEAQVTREKLVKTAMVLYANSRHKPEINKISGEIMWPEDCRCKFQGMCLSYCNPYQ